MAAVSAKDGARRRLTIVRKPLKEVRPQRRIVLSKQNDEHKPLHPQPIRDYDYHFSSYYEQVELNICHYCFAFAFDMPKASCKFDGVCKICGAESH